MNTPKYPAVQPHDSRAEAVASFWAVLAPHLVADEVAPESRAA